jgi:hypothetical protein
VQPPSAAIFHGTFIAGLVGAVGNNAIGGAGLNWSVRLMAIRFIGGDLSEPGTFQFTDSIAVAAFDYAVTMKRRGVNLRLINLSAGGYRPSVPWADVIQTAGDEGILTVCGAGNNAANSDLWSGRPAGYNLPGILSVTASTPSDALADFATYGATTVDLAAPGINMSSTWESPGYFSGRSGASYAAPLVVGAAALLLAREPGLTVDQLKAALLGSTDHPPGLRGKLVSHGRLNVARALDYLTLADPPALVVFAAPGGQRTLLDEPLRLTFSRPMNRASVEAALAITPPVAGTFEWSADNRNLVVRHDLPFDTTTPYTVRLLGTAEDENGGTLDGDFDQVREGSPGDDFVWTFRFQTPNDDFADAQVLQGESGSVAGDNRHTFVEWEEPRWFATPTYAYGNSLWYRWTSPATGWFTFDLTSATPSFDSVLGVSTGDRLAELKLIAWNDQYGNRAASRTSFPAEAGTEYSIVVATKNEVILDGTGSFRLSWYPTPPPGFTGSQFSPVRGLPGARVVLTGTSFTGATAVLFGEGSAAFTNALTNNLDLRITATVPPDASSGPITVVTSHGSVISTATFQVLPPPLSIARLADGRIEVRWPATSTAFLLETSDNLAGLGWRRVQEVPRQADGQSMLVLSPAGQQFYRLRAE